MPMMRKHTQSVYDDYEIAVLRDIMLGRDTLETRLAQQFFDSLFTIAEKPPQLACDLDLLG